VTESAAWRVVFRGIVVVFALLLLEFILSQLQGVLVQLALAILLAAAANPLVEALTHPHFIRQVRLRPSRGIAALMVFLSGLLVLVLGVVLVVATVAPDLRALAASAPAYVIRAETLLQDLLASNPDLAARVNDALPSVQSALGGAMSLLGQAPRLLGVATGLFSGILYLLFTLILALYLTIDGDRIRRYVIQFLPFGRHEQALQVTERIGVRLGAWARGEALLGVIIGAMTWIVALVLGLPYAGALALIAAIGELVPNLGPIIAASPLITVGFLVSPQQGLLAIVAAVLIQQLENNLIVPRVMARAVDLHPVAVMLAILAGGELLGIPGALMAVPFVASLSVVIQEIQRERLERHLAVEDSSEAAVP
jgi:predicted PurR-regulated permease PerM